MEYGYSKPADNAAIDALMLRLTSKISRTIWQYERDFYENCKSAIEALRAELAAANQARDTLTEQLDKQVNSTHKWHMQSVDLEEQLAELRAKLDAATVVIEEERKWRGVQDAELEQLREKVKSMEQERHLDKLTMSYNHDCTQQFYDELVKLGVATKCATHNKNCAPHVVASTIDGIKALQAELADRCRLEREKGHLCCQLEINIKERDDLAARLAAVVHEGRYYIINTHLQEPYKSNFKKVLDDLPAAAQRLLDDMKTAKDALEWYGAKKNYISISNYLDSPIAHDNGQRARTALAAMREKEKASE